MRTKAPGISALTILGRAQDAQRCHRISFTFVARPTQDLVRALAALTRLGVLNRAGAERPGGAPTDGLRFVCTLRYTEGRPLVSVATTPRRRCGYHDLLKRCRLGHGAGALL